MPRKIEVPVLVLPDRAAPWGLPLVVATTNGAIDVAQQYVDPAHAIDLAGRAAANSARQDEEQGESSNVLGHSHRAWCL